MWAFIILVITLYNHLLRTYPGVLVKIIANMIFNILICSLLFPMFVRVICNFAYGIWSVSNACHVPSQHTYSAGNIWIGLSHRNASSATFVSNFILIFRFFCSMYLVRLAFTLSHPISAVITNLKDMGYL